MARISIFGWVVAVCAASVASAASSPVIGDLNLDGVVDLYDVEPMAVAIMDPDEWQLQFGEDLQTLLSVADYNGNGVVDIGDTQGITSQLPAGPGGLLAIPGGGISMMMMGGTTPIELLLEARVPDPPTTLTPTIPVPPPVALRFNNDDDDGDGAVDFGQTGFVTDEDDFVRLFLTIKDPNSPIAPRIKLDRDLALPLDPHYRLYRWPRDGSYTVSASALEMPADGVFTSIRVLRRGDMNRDGAVTVADINMFVAAVSDPNNFLATYGPGSGIPDPWSELDLPTFPAVADMNGDGKATVGDINLFTAAIGTQTDFVEIWMWAESRWYDLHVFPSDKPGTPTLVVQYDDDNVSPGVPDCCPPPSGGPGDPCLNCEVELDIKIGCKPDVEQYELHRAPDYDCEHEPSFISRCWLTSFFYGGEAGYCQSCFKKPAGFPLQLDLAAGVAPPDLPPRSLNPTLSSMPMVAADTSHSGLNPNLERETLNDVIDLATGQALLQDIDFELPFGGAVFRHVRTFSESPADAMLPWLADVPFTSGYASAAVAAYWDWNGLNWMMSENPILLIDAGYQGVVNPNDGGNHRRCYFIPDAHHSIPFDKLPDGRYAAPAGFDATLTTQGTTPDGPEFFIVKLDRGAVTYTFRAVYEDMWTVEGASGLINVHDTPPDGYGIPYYGLLEQVEDRYGNRAVYEYCDFEQTACTAPDSANLCNTCCQNCNEKGQLKAIRLYAGDTPVGGTPQWTILYTHRAFANWHKDGVVASALQGYSDGADRRDDRYFRHKVHAIYVYEGDVPTPTGCMTIPMSTFRTQIYDAFTHPSSSDMGVGADVGGQTRNGCTIYDSFGKYDQIEYDFADPQYDAWRFRVKYLYEEIDRHYYLNAHAHNSSYDSVYWIAENEATTSVGGRLHKVTVSQKDPADSPDSLTIPDRHTMYRYQYEGGPKLSGYTPLLVGVLYNDTIADFVDRLNATDIQHGDIPEGARNCIQPGNYDENLLLILPDYYEFDGVHLIDLADLKFELAPLSRSNGNGISVAQSAQVDGVTGSNTWRLARALSGFSDRRSDEQKSYKLWFMHKFPRDITINDGLPQPHANPTFYRYPYRMPDAASWVLGGLTFPTAYAGTYLDLPLDQPFYIAVVDELDPEASYNGVTGQGVRQRMVWEINPAGYVLAQRTYRGEELALAERSGLRATSEYANGRLLRRYSVGYNSPENGSPATDGMIHEFEYFDDADGNPNAGELKAVYILKGDNGTQRIKLQEYDRGIAYTDPIEGPQTARMDLITAVHRYPVVGGPAETISRDYTFQNDDPVSGGIIGKEIRKPATSLTLGGPAYDSVEKMLFDDSGRPTWSGRGSETGGAVATWFADVQVYDDRGQQKLKVFDVDAALAGTGDIPAWPAEMPTRTAEASPLHHVTSFVYSPEWGLVKIVNPDGTETHFIYITDAMDPQYMEQRIYRDVRTTGSSWSSETPVEINYFDGGRITRKDMVTMVAAAAVPDPTDTVGEVHSSVEPTRDETGRVTGTTQTGGTGGPSLTTSVLYGAGGNIVRQVEPDGTITRSEFNFRGQQVRTFRGTDDSDGYWTTGTTDNHAADNMTLVEKRYYRDAEYTDPSPPPGAGVNDSGMLVQVRTYPNLLADQYNYTNEDTSGRPTYIQYDWRMREVCVEQRDEAGVILGSTFTWYDNLDRVRFVATYDDDDLPPTAADPRSADYNTAVPAAAAFYAGIDVPRTLTETIYNARGAAKETRQYYYDTVTTDLTYSSSYRFFDFKDRPVEVRTPGSPAVTYAYDAKGRQFRSSTEAGGLEATRVETGFNDADQAITSTRYERWNNSSGDIDTGAGIRSYGFTWYDDSGRVVATADLGTNNTGFTDSGGAAPTRPATAPSTHVLAGFPDALVTRYEYDDAGNQIALHHPDGTVTRSEYDGLNRLVMTIENADAVSEGERQITAYLYECADSVDPQCPNGGRLVKMAAVLPGHNGGNVDEFADVDWTTSNATIQITEFIYDADVVSDAWSMGSWSAANGWPAASFTVQSQNNAWISQVKYPDGDTVDFKYYLDGSVAYRKDLRGNEFYHVYDDRGRRVTTYIDDTAYYANAPINPAGRVHLLEYDYTADGLLSAADAYSYATNSAGTVVSRLDYTYNGRRRLESETQENVWAGAAAKTVDYAWEYSPVVLPGGGSTPGYNFDRLVSITYPTKPVGGQRVVTYHYGDNPDDIDSGHSRITDVVDTGGTGVLATYGYVGGGRRVDRTLTNAGTIEQSVGSGGTYNGLDAFGRLVDLHYALSGGGATRQRYEYGYDANGNRTHARVEQVGFDNKRSYLYAYDGLQRLVFAEMGQLGANNDTIVPDPNVILRRRLEWNLDTVGNWNGGTTANPGLTRDDWVLSGSPTPTSSEDVTHATDVANQVTTVTYDDGGGAVTTDYVHDTAGNLVFDGELVHCYDAFNRLVAVYRGDGLALADFESDGRIKGSATVGERVAEYVYEGAGRLIYKQARAGEDVSDTYSYEEEYYYDGVRRIQELTTYPTDTADFLWSANAPHASAVVQVREYAWGEGDVDEAICQFADVDDDATFESYYYLQDGNNNVVGITDAAGAVLVQYQYEPYGNVAIRDVLVAPPTDLPKESLGFQGLFADRHALATTPAPGETALDSPLEPGATVIYLTRNRAYSPELGRFLSRDPNEAAMPVVSALLMNGEALFIALGMYNPTGQHEDGLNLYLFASGNPVNLRDPLGLMALEDDVDALIGQISGERAANAAVIGAAVGRVVSTAQQVGSVLLTLVPGYDAVVLAVKLAKGEEITMGEVLLAAGGLIPGAAVAKSLGAFSGIIGHFGKRIIGKLLKFGDEGVQAIATACRKACFPAGTLIATDAGAVPIESIRVGDRVLTRHSAAPESGDCFREVDSIFVRFAPVVVTLVLDDGERLEVTPEHPIWCRSQGAWLSAGDLAPGDAVGNLSGETKTVKQVTCDTSGTLVFNFEVAPTHSYYANGIWVHNCIRMSSRIKDSSLLVREAKRTGRSHQADIDALTLQLSQGNFDPGTGTTTVFGTVREARARGGARVYFRSFQRDGETFVEILAKSDKGNQTKVINELRRLYE